MEERLHKVLADAGVASRRASERLIAEGKVAIDGEVVTEMGVKVDPEEHTITVEGRPIAMPQRKVYILLNKPKGVVTTRSDPHATHTVMRLITEVPVPVHPVGRLDKDTEGALILTNDGEFTHLLTHPRHGVPKLYQAHVQGVPDEKALDRLRRGVRLEDGLTAPAEVRLLGVQGDRAALEIILREGRNRQVRRMLQAVGHPVESLRRAAIGPVNIRKLPVGAWRPLAQKEIHALRRLAMAAVEIPEPRPETKAVAAGKTPPRPASPASAGMGGGRPVGRPSRRNAPMAEGAGPARAQGRPAGKQEGGGRPARESGRRGGPAREEIRPGNSRQGGGTEAQERQRRRGGRR